MNELSGSRLLVVALMGLLGSINTALAVFAVGVDLTIVYADIAGLAFVAMFAFMILGVRSVEKR